MDNTKTKTGIRPFGWRDKVGYMLGDVGCNLSFSLISGYMFIFFTQFIGISLIHYSLVILFTKIWDGINDPIIGAIADRFTPKKGDKFRPWIFWGSFPLAFSACLLFLNTQSASYAVKIIVCIVGYLIWDIAYTVVNVPFGSMNSTITADGTERSQLSSWRTIGALLAALPIAIVLPQILYTKETLANGTEASIFAGERVFTVALVLGILALVCFQLLYRLCTERIKHTEATSEKFNYFKTLAAFFTNRDMLAVSLTAFSSIVFMMSTQTTNALVFQMYFGDGSLSSFAVIAMIPMLALAPLVKPMVKRFGKKALCSWPLLGGVAALAILLVLPNVSVPLFLGLQIVVGLSMGFYSLVGWALVSDSIDSMELQTGRREEGSAYATYSMLRKVAQGVGQALIPFLIAVIIPGLDMNDAMTWSTDYGLGVKNIAAGLCLIGFIAAFLLMLFVYTIDKKKEQSLPALLGRAATTDDVADEIGKNISRRED